MANEFVARHGLISRKASIISESLNVSGSVIAFSFTGSLLGTSSYTLNSSTASYVVSSSYTLNSSTASYIPILAGPNITVNYQLNGIAISGSNSSGTPGGLNTQLQFNSASTFSGSSNLTFDYSTNNLRLTGSFLATNITSSLFGTSSWAVNSISASYITASNVRGIIAEVSGGTNQSSYTIGDTLYATASNILAKRSIGNAGQIYTVDSTGLPIWKDAPVFGSLNYFWSSTASAVAGYYKQITSPEIPLNSFSTAGVIDGQLLRTYITEPSNPNRTFIPAGEYSNHVHAAKTAGTKDAYIYVEIWETNSTGVDIAKIATAGPSVILSGTETEYNMGYATPLYTLASTGSRIATKVYATVTGGGSAPTIALYTGNASDSRTNLPTVAIDISLYVPYTGSTGNINLGSFGISGSLFGTASQAVSASYVVSSSYALNASSGTGSFTGSFNGDGSGLTGIVAAATPRGPATSIQFNDSGTTSGSSAFSINKNLDRIFIKSSTSATTGSLLINTQSLQVLAPPVFSMYNPNTSSYNLAYGAGNVNNYFQYNIQNYNTGNSASTDYVATNDIGSETSYFVNMGINSSTYINNGNGVGTGSDAYIYGQGERFYIGNKSTGSTSNVHIFAGGAPTSAGIDTEIFISSSGYVGINTLTPKERLDVLGNINLVGNIIMSGTINLNNEITINIGGKVLAQSRANYML